MYYEDLGTCTYFERWPNLIAIGWLDSDHPFTQGPVGKDFARKLGALLRKPYQPCIRIGAHSCDYCDFGKRGRALEFLEGSTIECGSSNLFVPSRDGIYVAPSMIAHYVRKHIYEPPLCFQAAVMDCPPMGSPYYFDLMSIAGFQPIGDWPVRTSNS